MPTNLQKLQELKQSVWLDNIQRSYLTSGHLQGLIDQGVSGLTSNPSIFEKAITGSSDYDDALVKLAGEGKNAEQIFESLTADDIRAAADLLRPVYDARDGADGFASYEVSPHLAHDTAGTIADARRLHAELNRPNIMIKVPATPEGVPAIRTLIGEGINVNVTLIFSLDAYANVREAYISGLEDLAASGGDVSKVASVASFFVSRVDSAVDSQIEAKGNQELNQHLGKAAISNAKLAYRDFKVSFGGERFAALEQKGARVQRPLWASTSTKNPAYSDVLYVETLVGQHTVNTMPDNTMDAYLDHGKPALTLEDGLGEAENAIQGLESGGINMEQVTAKLLADGVKAFADSFDSLLENVEEKRARLASTRA